MKQLFFDFEVSDVPDSDGSICIKTYGDIWLSQKELIKLMAHLATLIKIDDD